MRLRSRKGCRLRRPQELLSNTSAAGSSSCAWNSKEPSMWVCECARRAMERNSEALHRRVRSRDRRIAGIPQARQITGPTKIRMPQAQRHCSPGRRSLVGRDAAKRSGFSETSSSPIRKRRHQSIKILPSGRRALALPGESVPGGDQFTRRGAPELCRVPPQNAEPQRHRVLPRKRLRWRSFRQRGRGRAHAFCGG